MTQTIMDIILNKPQTISHNQCITRLAAIEDTLYVIGGKWKLKIIIALQEHGNIRFNELQRSITGISARVLSNELKDLELNGFVKRVVYADQTPVIVEYASTDYNESLKEVIDTLVEWGINHKKKITSTT